MTSREAYDTTKTHVIELARKKAEELNIPWGDEIIAKPMVPLWRSGPAWRVISIRFAERLVVTMWVNARSGKAAPRKAIYYTPEKFEARLKAMKIRMNQARYSCRC